MWVVCGLLMPFQSRESYFALRALNVELASIKDGGGLLYDQRRKGKDTSNVALKLRMQWWNDSIFTLSSSSGNSNPIVRSMHRAIQESNFTIRFLQRLMEARSMDLDCTQYSTMNDLIQYSHDTHSSLLYLQLECCSGDVDEQVDIIANHIGIGLGIVTTIRSIVYRASIMGEIAIPNDLLQQYDVSHSDFFQIINHEGTEKEVKLKGAVQQMAQLAHSYLNEARKHQDKLPKNDKRIALLPAVIGFHYLHQLQHTYQYDVLYPQKQANRNNTLSSPMEQLKFTMLLGRAYLTGIF